MQVVTGMGMLGRIQVMPGWTNDPVWRHDGQQGREGRGMIGYPPGQTRVAGRKGGAVIRRIAT